MKSHHRAEHDRSVDDVSVADTECHNSLKSKPSARRSDAGSRKHILIGGRVTQSDIERISHATLRELGVANAVVAVTSGANPGEWRIEIQAEGRSRQLRIRCGQGSTAQWVHQQIFDQYTAHR